MSVTLLHLNDVYELTPVSGGSEGGLARVAALRQRLLEENPNTYTVLAGDLLNPSALSTAIVDGERLAGRQMVDVMNVLGLDFATFGNHEFDLGREEFLKRLSESRFTWFSSNVSDEQQQLFPGIPRNVVFTVQNEDGPRVRIGLFGLTVGSNPASYVGYRDPVEVATEQVAELRPRVDILIAVTHLNVDADIEIAQRVRGIDLIVGGHEHENAHVLRGPDFTPVLKADANARSAYVHRLEYETRTRKLRIDSTLERVTAALPDHPVVADAVRRWVDVAFAGFEGQGFDPRRPVTNLLEPLDGREASVRNTSTRLTELLTAAVLRSAPAAKVAIVNSGSLRIDDVLPPGTLTEYDIIRTMPFGGTVWSLQMQGSLLQRVLDQGVANRGTGGYLQTAGVSRDPSDEWKVDGDALDPAGRYLVAMNDFLLSGREAKLEFLTRDHPEVTVVGEHGDIRRAFIEQLRATYGPP